MLDRFVLHNARRFSDLVAFGGLVRQCRFSMLEACISRLAYALQDLRDWTPRLTAVQCSDSWRHWMLTLALGRLGLTSASLPDGDIPEEMLRVLSPELIIVHRGSLTEGEGRLVLGDSWFDTVLEGVEHDTVENSFPPVAVASDTLCRISVAMGTDRDMHVLAFTFSEIETALLRFVYQDGGRSVALFASQEDKPHVLCTISPVSISGFLMVGAALTVGTTVRGTDYQNIGTEVTQGHDIIIIMTPVHLEHLLKALPPGMTALRHIYLTVVGAPLSQKLLERTYQLLTPHVQVVYGVDECGLIASIEASDRVDERSVGRVLPWAGVEIVDHNDQKTPFGEVGIVRLRSAISERGYFNEEGRARHRFRDGWFYPGDRGFLSKMGELHLCGRVDEIVAIGGAKFDLSVIDRLVKEEPVVRDAGSFVLWNSEGQQVLYCALVTDGDLDGEALSRKLRKRYTELPPMTALWVGDIPYTELGHVDRKKLEQSLSVHLNQQ